MALDEMMKQVALSFEKEGNSKAVFGDPHKLETTTVIPVAAVRFGAAGAGVGPPTKGSKWLNTLLGGGAGGSFDVRPVGFISERDGQAVFTPIHLDVRNKPFLNELSHGLGRLFEVVPGLATAAANRFTRSGVSKSHGRS